MMNSNAMKWCACVGVAMAVLVPPARGDVRLKGYVGDRLEACLRNNLIAKDVTYLTDPFKAKSETHWWRTEFWGKWMHAAQPFAAYLGDCAALKAKIAAGAKAIAATQESDGYIGDYTPEHRNRLDWDVWGHKYTILGLVYASRATGDRAPLETAMRLADHVMNTFGPGKRHLNESGHYHGLASCSILEAFVLLYRDTKERKYLDYAGWIVREMDEGPSAPRLLADANVSPCRRVDDPTRQENLVSARKAYEMMSCYQGLLEYYDECGGEKLLKAADATARLIAKEEINICGGAASDEVWYGGAERQDALYGRLQETCVTVTWMRLCEKLLTLTGDPFYADEIEKSFFNAYLGALAMDGSWFASYTPLMGTRSAGQYHCNMHENCCDANGPRGFLVYLNTYMTSRGDDVCLNHFSSARAKAPLASGGDAEFEVFSLYPNWAGNGVAAIFRGREPRTFTLKVRVPAWATKSSFGILPAGGHASLEPVSGATPGRYLSIRRTWTPGDRLEFTLDMTPVAHRLHDNIAFTAGPVVLARDMRFGDGDLSEGLMPVSEGAWTSFFRTRPAQPEMAMTYALWLPVGQHDERPEAKLGDVVRFCDYASAGNDWSPKSAYRVWLPMRAHRER